MEYLLDTHAILWYAQGSSDLSSNAKNLMENEICYFSMASFWEIAIKQKLNKLDATLSIPDLEEFCLDMGFLPLEITSSQIENTKTLPFIHRDPFDRLLISQAQKANLTIITCDSIIPQYAVKTVW